MTAQEPYNPLAKENLGRSVAEALLQSEPISLGELERFNGAGIYAIYYTGDFDLYEPMTRRNRDGDLLVPIYVGKASPPGARTGDVDTDKETGTKLFDRLKEHGRSISAAENLHLSDFHCRYLVVDDIWIPLGESLLIATSPPLWNKTLDGFGNHAPGGGRKLQERSRWDVIHPGRKFADGLAPRTESEEQIRRVIAAQLRDQFD